MKVTHLKTGNEYEVVTEAIDATNESPTHGKEMVVYQNEKGTFVREKEEFWTKFKKKPNTCCVCGTEENLHRDGWYGYRCNKEECIPY